MIRKKEHFGDRTLQKVIVPPYAEAIEDWAYASCTNLREVWLPCGCRVSEKAFLGSDIRKVYLYRDEEQAVNGSPVLLALSFCLWPKEISSALDVAEKDELFLIWVKERLDLFLQEPDDKGFRPFLAGGEEDYKEENEELEQYKNRSKRNKLQMILEWIAAASYKDESIAEQDINYNNYINYINGCEPKQYFDLVKESADRRPVYEELFLGFSFYEHVSTDELLRAAGDDVELRALVLRREELGTQDVLTRLEI